jgi:leucyl aminopeptidase
LIGGEDWRQAGASIAAAVRSAEIKRATIHVEAEAEAVQALVEGAVLGDYAFTAYRSGKAGKRSKLTLRLPGHGPAVKAGLAVASSQNLARTFGDLPPNDLTPAAFAKRASAELAELGLAVTVVSGSKALAKAGFPGLVAVGQGSVNQPALLEIRYQPKKRLAKGGPKLALVGKGITFDSGGISLKPGAGMWEMKMDMCGAAAVLGAIRLIAEQQPAVPVTAYIALAENMPGGEAQRPGDIYQARNGTFIHVDNTDAEGRLVLSDVLTYACEQGATHVVDAATLTGAALVGLGMSVAAVMGRQGHDGAWVEEVRAAGQDRGEEFWPLPLYGEYRRQLDHPHADINNIGGRTAGTITAGMFLAEFVSDDVQWAHCDIAGPAMRTDSWRYYSKGATGFAVRSFARLAQRLAEPADG